MTSATTSDHIKPIIRFHDVHKRFGPLVVLDGLNLDIPQDQTTVVIGPSGTGKSVLLKHIVGLLKADSGSVWFHDQQVDKLSEEQLEPIRKKIGFLFQQGALFDSMNVGDNVAYPLRLYRLKSESEIPSVVHEKLSVVGMDGSEKKMPADLSGGQRKRVALARAIAMNPEVILYDEPTTGLDPIRSDVINMLIVKLKKQLKVTSVTVTHDMQSAFKIGDRIVMLHEGKIITDGTPAQIQSSDNEIVRRFVLGEAN